MATGSITFADGIVTSVHGQAAFDAALSGLIFADDSEKALLPYGIVVQNEGPFTVVAYCLQWVFDDGDGAPIIRERAHTQPFALDDGDKRTPLWFGGDMALDPDGSRLITPSRKLSSQNLNPPSYHPLLRPGLRQHSASCRRWRSKTPEKAAFASEIGCLCAS